ncbi:L-rhamnose mutarotase [Roseisalinus antarcticus]|uniref:L-rhamnose mutarotase n=1 Tax=Roseisalinus antarcticus TaxID=254357 RepID=A0A1Y5TWU0_9RHOB|nr:L-rhamnose mutarotase [Roseisalinus antarcticus]SLN75380.1 L-rhamnose mutarotase [Roseisalinus antarcticus]
MADLTRVSWVMHLKSGHEEAYRRKHDDIWPELAEAIRADGIRNYSIFRYGLTLFAYYEHEGPPRPVRPRDDIRLRWHEWMAPHMQTHPDNRPVSETVEEVFHID